MPIFRKSHQSYGSYITAWIYIIGLIDKRNPWLSQTMPYRYTASFFFSLPGECKEALHLTPSVWVRLPWFQPPKPRSVYLQCLTMQKRGVKRPLWGFPVNQRWKYTDGGVKLFKCPALNVKWSLKLRKRLRPQFPIRINYFQFKHSNNQFPTQLLMTRRLQLASH